MYLHRSYIARLFALIFCISNLAYADQTVMNTISFHKIITLSHRITTDIPLWPGDPQVQFKTVATMAKDGYYLREFSIGEHSATHMNAPNSFINGAAGIDSYQPSDLVHQAVVIDVSKKTLHDADYVITIDDVKAWEHQHGTIPAGSMVLFYTGWENYWHQPKKFLNIDADGHLHFPGVGGKTATFLLKQRHIAGIGIDTHGVDPSADENYQTNTQLMAAHKISIECITNLTQLPATGTTMVIGLPRLKDGSGSPVAITAFVP
ncbi:cyclase family protein [Celerinatantimonas yamalensis]|uniref:Cyclase family protein n=1 Tax=Celerinatantimonas yamalensis TaxID=559956 RepID=A0ABW9GF85_9GAMM